MDNPKFTASRITLQNITAGEVIRFRLLWNNGNLHSDWSDTFDAYPNVHKNRAEETFSLNEWGIPDGELIQLEVHFLGSIAPNHAVITARGPVTYDSQSTNQVFFLADGQLDEENNVTGPFASSQF